MSLIIPITGLYQKSMMMAKKVFKQITPEESINRSLISILNEIKYTTAGRRGIQTAYFGRFIDLKKDCLRIINAIERWEIDNG